MEPSLLDGRGRRIDYLRVSVTDRCNLRCGYCMPKDFKDFAPRHELLDFGEIERIVRIFAALGVRRVRLTGGEPLVRRDLAVLASRLAALPGVSDLSLSTNGTLLARHAAALRQGGVSRLNVSLDSLDRSRIRHITGRDVLPAVLDGLMAAKSLGFDPIKINMVALPGMPDAEVVDMAGFCMTHGFVLRLIEVMPVGAASGTKGPDLGAWRRRLQERFSLVEGQVPGGGPARYLVSSNGAFSIGFITPLSQHFCASCNRVRLAADGVLHLCLGQKDRVDLRGLLRQGGTDGEIAAFIRAGLQRKPARHHFGAESRPLNRVMAATGG